MSDKNALRFVKYSLTWLDNDRVPIDGIFGVEAHDERNSGLGAVLSDMILRTCIYDEPFAEAVLNEMFETIRVYGHHEGDGPTAALIRAQKVCWEEGADDRGDKQFQRLVELLDSFDQEIAAAAD